MSKNKSITEEALVAILEEKLSPIMQTVNDLKKLINNSRGKYKRNECLINVCKSDTDLS
jgi:hypothetical protein